MTILESRKATMQKAFNQVVKGLARQYFYRSVDEYGCAYRGYQSSSDDFTCKCAIGHLIPDDKYTSNLEGKLVTNSLLVQNAIPKSIVDAFGLKSLQELQQAHDRCESRDNMRQRLIFFAERHGLSIPEELNTKQESLA